MNKNNKRIEGFDFARALAIFGMIFVNFKVVMFKHADCSMLCKMVEAITGKAAALFVVLAGVGMTLMYKRAKKNNQRISILRISFLKRALFLFIVGMSYYAIWPADILHYYGLYLAIGVFLLGLSTRWLVSISIFNIILYTVLVLVLNYDHGWDWKNFVYTDFFTLDGFFRNLFFNGFHPAIPWLIFLITGICIGRMDFNNKAVTKKTLLISASVFLVSKLSSYFLVGFTKEHLQLSYEEAFAMFGTHPMPPLFFYIVSAGSLAVAIISLSVILTKALSGKSLIRNLITTGQMALTHYFAHVVFGMLPLYLFFGEIERMFSIEFIVIYSLVFIILIIIFSKFWKKNHERGPLETVMRKITG